MRLGHDVQRGRTAVVAASVILCACGASLRQGTARSNDARPEEARVEVAWERRGQAPVVLVHGIDDTSQVFSKMIAHLMREGIEDVSAVNLSPNNGDVPLDVLAGQLSAHVEEVRRERGATHVDVVAFSMGALVTRTWMLEQGGRHRVRRFVSISGPHAGTATGWLRFNAGATQMRWGSPLLRRLPTGAAALAPAEVFSLWTPLDLMIVPAHSSRLEGASERTFPVLLHPWMLQDERVLRSVTQALMVGTWAPERSQAPL